MAEPVTVNLAEVTGTLKEIVDRVQAINGAQVSDRLMGRERSARLAEISKELLFISHLCDRARLAALDEYHATRGFF